MDSLRAMLLSLLIGASLSAGQMGAQPPADALMPGGVVAVEETVTAAPTETPQAALSVVEASAQAAVPTPAPTAYAIQTGTDIARELYRGCEGDDVRLLQKLLKDLGYSVGVDGTFGQKTKDAVVRFQQNNGLKGDGIAGTRTIRKMVGGKAVRGDVEQNRSTLSYGMHGQDVRKMQTRLAELAYYADVVSGNFLTNTYNGVLWFQENNELSADGIAGPNTLRRLYSADAVPASGYPPLMPTPTPGTGLLRTLRKGMSGDDVSTLQQHLGGLGYFSGSTTGYFGSETEWSVRTFQQSNGLGADGVCGSATYRVLLSGNAVPYNPSRPTPTPGPLPTQGPVTYCTWCGYPIESGKDHLHAEAFCGAHHICQAGDHSARVCGLHFHCVFDTLQHKLCKNCYQWACSAFFPATCASDPTGQGQHTY